jgi:hypothetical protein
MLGGITMQKDLLEKETETEFERIAANFMVDPANAECIAEDAAWDVTVGDGLERSNALRRYFSSVVSPAEQEGLTEDDVMQLLNEK